MNICVHPALSYVFNTSFHQELKLKPPVFSIIFWKCVVRIRRAVSRKCGIDNFINYDDFTVAFAGSKDNIELMLEICTQKCEGKKYLYASVDDEVSWEEWDFDNLDEFENNIIEYIANRVDRTVKP